MYRLNRKMCIYGHFSVLFYITYTFCLSDNFEYKMNPQNVVSKQMYTLSVKMTIYGHFSIGCTFLLGYNMVINPCPAE